MLREQAFKMVNQLLVGEGLRIGPTLFLHPPPLYAASAQPACFDGLAGGRCRICQRSWSRLDLAARGSGRGPLPVRMPLVRAAQAGERKAVVTISVKCDAPLSDNQPLGSGDGWPTADRLLAEE